ncbi:MAG: site-specific integrase, partial [Rhodanobacteraceae bacterium]
MTAPLAADAARFLDYLKVERHYSPGTLRNYAHALEALVRFVDGLGLRGWGDLRGDEIQTLVANEHRRGLEPPSLRAMLSAFRSFFRFLAREGKIASNPAAGVRSPKVRRRLPDVLDVDEAATLVDVHAGDALAVRDHALLELLYSSGLRVSELCGVRWRDLDPDEGLLRVTGKGNKT